MLLGDRAARTTYTSKNESQFPLRKPFGHFCYRLLRLPKKSRSPPAAAPTRRSGCQPIFSPQSRLERDRPPTFPSSSHLGSCELRDAIMWGRSSRREAPARRPQRSAPTPTARTRPEPHPTAPPRSPPRRPGPLSPKRSSGAASRHLLPEERAAEGAERQRRTPPNRQIFKLPLAPAQPPAPQRPQAGGEAAPAHLESGGSGTPTAPGGKPARALRPAPPSANRWGRAGRAAVRDGDWRSGLSRK